MATGNYYFKFFYQRFIASTQGWKDDAIGAYLKLLIYQFDNDGLPDDFKFLCSLATSLKKNQELIMPKFQVCDDGKLRNSVMKEEFERAKSTSESNSKSVKKRWQKEENVSKNVYNDDTNEHSNVIRSKYHTNIPINQYTIKEEIYIKENLTPRESWWPVLEEVERVFTQQGGTKEQALYFFNQNEAVGWKMKGNDIKNFSTLVGNFIGNWHKNKQNGKQDNNGSYKAYEPTYDRP